MSNSWGNVYTYDIRTALVILLLLLIGGTTCMHTSTKHTHRDRHTRGIICREFFHVFRQVSRRGEEEKESKLSKVHVFPPKKPKKKEYSNKCSFGIYRHSPDHTHTDTDTLSLTKCTRMKFYKKNVRKWRGGSSEPGKRNMNLDSWECCVVLL